MKLHFLRHADAMAGPDDAARALSKKGIEQCRWLGAFCKQAGLRFDAVYSSPLVRAQQTAERVLEASHAKDSPKVALVEALLNEASTGEFEDWLDSLPGVKNILLVGHAPSLADRVRKLLGIDNPETIELPKASLITLKTEDRRLAILKGYITPRYFGY